MGDCRTTRLGLAGDQHLSEEYLSQDRCGLQVLKRRKQSTGWAEPPGGRLGARVWSSERGRLSLLTSLPCGSERAEAALAPQHRASSVQTQAFVSSNSILGPPHPESLRHRSPSGLFPPSTPSPRPRARRVHQLRLLPSRCCLGFNFCVALRKLPIITAAKRKQSRSTAVLQLCRLQSTAGRGCGPGPSRRGVRVAASPAVRGCPRGGPGCQEHPLSIIVTNEAFGKI